MRRWNGWGDDATSMDLSEAARAMMNARLGPGLPGVDATREAMLAQIPASRLAGAHPLIQSDAATRFAMAMGESFADWIRKRFGALPPVPDGVAFPESSSQVRELLDLAHANSWIVIPFAGGTSVAGHLDCPVSERPILSINLNRMNRLLHLDKPSQLATFDAGTPGPLVEAQLRAQGYTLGHFPQSFEYSTVGGWVVTRSSGLGAAILAAVSLKLHPDFATAIRKMTRIGQVFQPEPAHASTYDQLYRRVYRRLYQRLQPLYRDIRAITGYPAKD